MTHQSHILLICNEPSLADLIAMVLEEEGGFRVTTHANGIDAADRCTELQPDLVLLRYSWCAGHVSAFDICRQIRTRDATRHILVISAKQVPAYHAGATVWMDLVHTPEQLIDTISSCLAR